EKARRADGHAALFLEPGYHAVEDAQVRSTVDLGNGDQADGRRHGMLEIAHRELDRPVDAYADVGAAAADLVRGLLDELARTRLFVLGDAVLEIQHDAVGAAGMRAIDEPVDVHRNRQERPPHREYARGI